MESLQVKAYEVLKRQFGSAKDATTVMEVIKTEAFMQISRLQNIFLVKEDKSDLIREMKADKADLFREMKTDKAELLREMKTDKAELLREMKADKADLLREMKADKSEILREMKTDRSIMIRWMFVFWLAQISAVLGIIMMYFS